jgi:Mn-dependent DtxR family transcriptional regulator
MIASWSGSGAVICNVPPWVCEEDFLVAVYRLRCRHGEWVAIDALAEQLGGSCRDVAHQAGDLAAAGKVAYSPVHGVALTDLGTRVAKRVHRYCLFVRFGRVLERYQTERFGLPPAWSFLEHDDCGCGCRSRE